MLMILQNREREELKMKTELIIGDKTFTLNENGEKSFSSLELGSEAFQVPVWIYLIQNVETHFISMRTPNEEQQEALAMMELLEGGAMPFDDEEDIQDFLERHQELVGDGIFNQEIIDLGGVGITIEGNKYKLEYFFDGICPSEKISTIDGRVLSEISRDKITISLMNGETLCNFNAEDVSEGNLGINLDNNIEEFAKVSLNEEARPSVGVLFHEFDQNEKFRKAFKKIYEPAYKEKNNALRDIVTSVCNPDGTIDFLSGVTKEVIDEGMKIFPDKQFIYALPCQ